MSDPSTKTIGLGDLPEDIGRLIFECITESDRKTGFSCALVSRRVNCWVEPFLYRHVVIQRRDQLSHFHRTITMSNAKHHGKAGTRHCGGTIDGGEEGSACSAPQVTCGTSKKFASHVKSLVIVLGSIYTSGNSEISKILSILQACSGAGSCSGREQSLEMLAFSGHLITDRDTWTASKNLLEFIASPALAPRRLYVGSKLFHDHQRHFSHPIFRNATHIELVCQRRDFGDDLVSSPTSPSGPASLEQWDWDSLRHLGNKLTHLSVYFEPFWEVSEDDAYAECIEKAVSACPSSVKVFVAWLTVGALGRGGQKRVPEDLRAIQEGYLDSRVVVGYVAWAYIGVKRGPLPYSLVRSYEDMDNGSYEWDLKPDGEGAARRSMWALAEEIIEERGVRRSREREVTSG